MGVGPPIGIADLDNSGCSEKTRPTWAASFEYFDNLLIEEN